jgi:DNA-directed RNA polymerase specialized sigma24 family protein
MSDFDLDVAFEDQPAPDLRTFTVQQLGDAIEALPIALAGVARGILIENRTMSDVSQALGIRQTELVTRLHRAKVAIAAVLNKPLP